MILANYQYHFAKDSKDVLYFGPFMHLFHFWIKLLAWLLRGEWFYLIICFASKKIQEITLRSFVRHCRVLEGMIWAKDFFDASAFFLPKFPHKTAHTSIEQGVILWQPCVFIQLELEQSNTGVKKQLLSNQLFVHFALPKTPLALCCKRSSLILHHQNRLSRFTLDHGPSYSESQGFSFLQPWDFLTV